ILHLEMEDHRMNHQSNKIHGSAEIAKFEIQTVFPPKIILQKKASDAPQRVTWSHGSKVDNA
ncbi:MAG: hypothetical protein AAFY76_20340, partial [Cyanobacteria bacterium J06649_11]